MSTLKEIWRKISGSKDYRKELVSTMLKRGTAMQIQALMKERGWTQTKLAELSGVKQGVISRARNPEYGNLTFNTVIEIAGGFDVAFIGRFVPFSEFAKYVASLPDEIAFSIPSQEKDAEPQEQESEQLASGKPDPELAALLEKAKDHVMTDEEKQAQRESWVRGEMGLDRAPAPAEGAGLPAEAPGGGMIAPVGPHKRVFEYDGSYKCLDCKGKWGAFDGRPSMPLACGVAAPAGEEDWIAEAAKELVEANADRGRSYDNSPDYLETAAIIARHVPAITDERIAELAKIALACIGAAMILPLETSCLTLEEVKRYIILERYKNWRGSMQGLADDLGIHVTTLYGKLYEYGVLKSRKKLKS